MVNSVLYSNPGVASYLWEYLGQLILCALIYLYFLIAAFIYPLSFIIQFVAAILTSYELQDIVYALPSLIPALLPYAIAPIVATIMYFVKRDSELAFKTLKILHCQCVCTFLFICFDGLYIAPAFSGSIEGFLLGPVMAFFDYSGTNYISLLLLLIPCLIVFSFACYTLYILGSDKYDEIRKNDIEKKCIIIQLISPFALVTLSGLAGTILNCFIFS